MSAILGRRLVSTASRLSRSYDMIPVGWELADFVMVVRQGEPHRKDFDCSCYLVQFDGEQPENGWSFLVARDDGEVYQTIVVRSPASRRFDGSCTCKAGKTVGHCKHRDALTDAAFTCGLPTREDELCASSV